MNRGQAQYLWLYDTSGTTYQRWQSYYANTTVNWENNAWVFIPFSASGFTAGMSGDEANVTVTAPATSIEIGRAHV